MIEAKFLTNDGENVAIKLTEEEATYWQFFQPYLQGRWTNKVETIYLSASEVYEWIKLLQAMKQQAGKGGVELIYASLVNEVASSFFMASDERWREYVYVDELEDEQTTREALVALGHFIRDRGTSMPYHHTKQGYSFRRLTVHADFYLTDDPAMDFSVEHSNYDNMGSRKSIWSEPITPEEKQLALEIEDVSVLTGILHSAYLLSQSSKKYSYYYDYEEVNWNYVNWRHVTSLVEHPLMLSRKYSNYTRDDLEIKMKRDRLDPTYNRRDFITELVNKTNADKEMPNKHILNAVLSSPSTIGYDPERPLPLYKVDSRVDMSLYTDSITSYTHGLLHYSLKKARDDSEKTVYDTNFPGYLEFYVGALSYLASKQLTPEEQAGEGRLALCGLVPLLKNSNASKYSKTVQPMIAASQREIGYSFMPPAPKPHIYVLGKPFSIVPTLTVKALYRGFIYTPDKNTFNARPLHEDEFPSIVDYIISTLGTDVAVLLATVAMEHYIERTNSQNDSVRKKAEVQYERLLLFSDIVQDRVAAIGDVPLTASP